MDQPKQAPEKSVAYYSTSNRVLMVKTDGIAKAVGDLHQLAGCCGVWHFHSFNYNLIGVEEAVAEGLEHLLLSSVPSPGGRGMLLLTGSDKDGWTVFREAIEKRPGPWRKETFWNPRNGHEVWLFILLREELSLQRKKKAK